MKDVFINLQIRKNRRERFTILLEVLHILNNDFRVKFKYR